MTKQYMKFDDFKREFLAEDTKTRNPAGMFWNFHLDPKNDKNAHRGVIDFYYAVDNNQNKDGKHEEAIKTYIKNPIKSERPNEVTFDYSGVESPVEITHKFSKEYTLKRIRMPFNINTSKDADATKEKLRKFFKEKMREFTDNAKLYTSCELKDRNGKFYKNQDEDKEASVNLIDDMIHNPKNFRGYKDLKQRLQDIRNMSKSEFVDQYAHYGPIQALLVKTLFDKISKWRDNKKDKNDAPKFKNLNNKNEIIKDPSSGSTIFDITPVSVDSFVDNPANVDYLLTIKPSDKGLTYNPKEKKLNFNKTGGETKFELTIVYKNIKSKPASIEFSPDAKYNNAPSWNDNLKNVENYPTNKIYELDITSCIDNFEENKNDLEVSIKPNKTDKDYICTIEGTKFKFANEKEGDYSVEFTLSSKSKNFADSIKEISIHLEKIKLKPNSKP